MCTMYAGSPVRLCQPAPYGGPNDPHAACRGPRAPYATTQATLLVSRRYLGLRSHASRRYMNSSRRPPQSCILARQPRYARQAPAALAPQPWQIWHAPQPWQAQTSHRTPLCTLLNASPSWAWQHCRLLCAILCNPHALCIPACNSRVDAHDLGPVLRGLPHRGSGHKSMGADGP